MNLLKQEGKITSQQYDECQSDELADKYNITVTNSFQALGSLPEDVESSWLAIRNIILQSAQSVSDDAPTLGEVRRAIRKLRNGRAAGSDGIQPELLKYAEEPVSASLHSLFAQVWKSGLVPA